MNIVYTVRSDSPQASLAQLLNLPLGLDIWQVKEDHVVLRAEEAQAARLRQMGYTTDEIVQTETHISMFATAEAIAAYHSAETLEDDLRQLAESRPEIAELREIGRSVEERPIWALRIGERRATEHKLLFMGCHHAREWVSVEVPYLLRSIW
jgi:carboxypeptidase T